ncbi:recombinase family protein [Xanthovirga aplysinae]|uniref:recombinase family protein n=1 Tax=Xanthovirga aplysinae TaxID=2529853 RepID=UPI0012BCF562|nr:recombinase family protein [Xanthovirga aplysinae]MTI29709.1 hypothetical protein [Xanthovirga aplysinae]
MSTQTIKKQWCSKMMDFIDHGGVDTVFVSEVSRLGRKVVDVLNTVEEIISKN